MKTEILVFPWANIALYRKTTVLSDYVYYVYIYIYLTILFQVPKTEAEWESISQQLNERWNFPHCIGAIDGRHVLIKPPPSSGSFYFNYKHSFSIVLLAVVDADYKFLYVDIGCNGRVSDGGVFKNSALYAALDNKSLSIPSPKPIPGQNKPLPYMIVADDAFQLKEYNYTKAIQSSGIDKRKAQMIFMNQSGHILNAYSFWMKLLQLKTAGLICRYVHVCPYYVFTIA